VFPEVEFIPGNEFLDYSKFSISRLEPEYLNTFQKTLIYLLIDWPFNFLRPILNKLIFIFQEIDRHLDQLQISKSVPRCTNKPPTVVQKIVILLTSSEEEILVLSSSSTAMSPPLVVVKVFFIPFQQDFIKINMPSELCLHEKCL